MDDPLKKKIIQKTSAIGDPREEARRKTQDLLDEAIRPKSPKRAKDKF